MPTSEEEFRQAALLLNNIARRSPAADGNLSYAGGVDYSSQWRNMRIDQLTMLVNGTVRDGSICTRPGDTQLEIAYTNAADQAIVERGKVQGYQYWSQQETTVWAIDGNLFSYVPGGTVRKLNPSVGKPFSKVVDHVHFQERDGAMIAQDGINPAVIVQGAQGRHSDRSLREVPTGTVMADGWGRLALVDPGRRRITFSDHTLNPNSDGLRFANEIASYFLAAPYFQVPARIGPIVGAEFMPYLDTDTGVGPLLVFGTSGTMAYNVNVDRSQWSVQDIASMILPTIGLAGPYGLHALAAELIFIDQNGRLRSIRNARDEESTINLRPFDREVYDLYREEPPDLKKFRMVWEFDDRLFCGIQPESTQVNSLDPRYNVHMNGMVVRNLDPAAPYAGTEQPIWDGLWTGLRPLGVVTGQFRGQERSIILSKDSDGKNRFYEQTKSAKFDTSASQNGRDAFVRKAIEAQAILKESDFGSPRSLKEFREGELSLDAIHGPVEIRGRWESDGSSTKLPWFTHHENYSEAIKFDYSQCRLIPRKPGYRRSLALTKVSSGTDITCNQLRVFKRGRGVLDWKGFLCIRELTLEVTESSSGNDRPDCEQPPVKNNHPESCHDFYSYHAASAPDMAPEKCVSTGCPPTGDPLDSGLVSPVPGTTAPGDRDFNLIIDCPAPPGAENTPPVLTLTGGSVVISVGDLYVEQGATAIDAEDGDLTAAIIINASLLNTAVAGIYSVTYEVMDSGGLLATAIRQVTVEALPVNLAPVLTVIGGSVVITAGDPYIDPGATAVDAEDGNLTGDIVVTSTVNPAVAGVYAVNYQVTDSGGLSAFGARVVTVLPANTAPTITLNGGDTTIPNGYPYLELGATANDLEDGDLTGAIVIDASAVDVNVDGTYPVTYTVTDSGGLTTQVTRNVTVDSVATDPPGFFAAPGVAFGSGLGTFSDPWSLEEALNGDLVAHLVPGETLNLLAGTFQKPFPASGFAGLWDVGITGVTIKPWQDLGFYEVVIEGGFRVNAPNNTIEELYFRNLEAPPGGEPTPPGDVPNPLPPHWFEWGAVGVHLTSAAAANTIVRNNAIEGGAGGVSSFDNDGVQFSDNIIWEFGWLSTEAKGAHGHGGYIRPLPGQTMSLRGNLISNTRHGRTEGGNYAFQIFATNPSIGTVEVLGGGYKGGIFANSTNGTVASLTFSDNVVEELFVQTAPGVGGSEVGLGRAAVPDGALVHDANTYVNSMAAAENGNWTTSASSPGSGAGNRVFKTDGTYWRVELRKPPGDLFSEEGTFTDVTGGGGVDEIKIFPNQSDPNRANIVLLDLDGDGNVTADLSAFVANGETFEIYHYRNLQGAPVAAGAYAGPVLIPVQDEDPVTGFTDATDHFVLRKNI